MPNNICCTEKNKNIYYCVYDKNTKNIINGFKIEYGTTLVDNVPDLNYTDSICSDNRDIVMTDLVNNGISLNNVEIPE